MRQLLLGLSAIFIAASLIAAGSGSAQAQGEICPIAKARPFHPAASLGRSFRNDTEAQEIVLRIRGVLSITDEILACVSDSADYDNAHALVGPTDKKRYIVFNRGWMNNLRSATGNYWSLIGIAAHEVGHHGARHELTPFMHNCRLNHRVELQADYFSGFALGKLGAKQDDATASMRQMSPIGACSHPPRGDRIAMVTEGWQDAMATAVAAAPASGPGATPGHGATAESSTARSAAPPRARSGRAAAPTSTAGTGTGTANALTGRAEDALARVKTDYRATASRFRIRNNRDILGHDIKRVIGITLDGCADACEKNAACKGFSFDRWNGWCFLKDAMPASVLDPASTIGVRVGVEFPMVDKIEHEMLNLKRRKFVDTPLRVLANSNFAECREACDKELSCVAFTAEREANKCRLFRQTDGHFADEGFDSGFKRQVPQAVATGGSRTRSGRTGGSSGSGPVVLTQETATGFAGTGYDRHEDASYADCEALCRRDARCTALEHVAKTKVCRLYEAAGAKKPVEGTMIAIKGGA